MTRPVDTLLLEARGRAGLSQRELARRAKTAQSVVARIETGLTSPTWETLTRLVGAAGLDIIAELEPQPVVGSHMLGDVQRILAMTPEARLQEVADFSRFVGHARRATVVTR
jgi:transcriptional regulator with XRE-family HTH domain